MKVSMNELQRSVAQTYGNINVDFNPLASSALIFISSQTRLIKLTEFLSIDLQHRKDDRCIMEMWFTTRIYNDIRCHKLSGMA